MARIRRDPDEAAREWAAEVVRAVRREDDSTVGNLRARDRVLELFEDELQGIHDDCYCLDEEEHREMLDADLAEVREARERAWKDAKLCGACRRELELLLTIERLTRD